MKLILKIVAVLVVLLIVAVFAVFLYIDSIAKSAIEKGGTAALDVETTVSKVDIGIFSGQVGLAGLSVANPEGFDEGYFLNLGSGEVAVSIGDLMAQPAVLPKLDLADVDLYLEKKPGKKGNYEVILANLKRFESDTETPAKPDKDAKRFVINQVVISNVNVVANFLPIGGKAASLKFNIPELRFEYDTDEGLPMGQIAGTILKAILTSVVEQAGGVLPDDLLGGLGEQLADLQDIRKLGADVVGELAKPLEDVVKDVGNIDKVGEQVGKALEDGLGKKLDGLGGLLKKKEKSK